MFDDTENIHFIWEDDIENNTYLLKYTGSEARLPEKEDWRLNNFLIKIVENNKQGWDNKSKWVAYLNHDFLAQLMFPTDGIRARIELLLYKLSDDIIEAKEQMESQVRYSFFRKRTFTFHKTRQQKIDGQINED